MKFINTPLIKIITGIRRSGKSSVLTLISESIVESGIESDRIVYLNMESLENSRFKDILELNSFIREKYALHNAPVYLFIDEVQEIPQWERAVNSFLSDTVADIFISGSNSGLLSGELASHLTGRYVEFSVYPLTYSEFCMFRKNSHIDRQPTSDFHFMEFVKYGGFPGLHRLVFSDETIYQYLSSLSDSILLKDVVMRNNVRDVALLRSLLIFLADNCGNIFSARSVADYMKKERRSLGIETIYNYISYLEAAFVIYRISRYDIKGKRLLETQEKYYLADLGLRHALLGYREKDIGIFLENIVCIELKKRGYIIHIGKLDDYEIDFIAIRGNEKMYIQVAYLIADETTHEREFRPLRLIADNYPKYVLSMDMTPPGNTEGIIRMYLPDFLLSDGETDSFH